ncbi:hypothetical protein K5K75_001441 [Campylobacter coli]|nr:hypothetical protein [Campylobacter coli]
MNKHIIDLTNKKFGSLRAIEYAYSKNRMAFWKYECDCGNIIIKRSNTITYQTKKYMKVKPKFPSCGCKELEQKTKHGYRKLKDTHPLYKVYNSMMNRCYNSNLSEYKHYGALGVTVCNEWKNNPKAFIEWGLKNGYKKGLSIDKDILCEKKRIYPKVYSPETCQFISKFDNNSYSSSRKEINTHKNVKLTIEQANDLYHKYKIDKISGPKLSKMFGIGTSSVYKIIHKKDKIIQQSSE